LLLRLERFAVLTGFQIAFEEDEERGDLKYVKEGIVPKGRVTARK